MKGNVVITGVSSGIGKAAAEKFVKEGYRVFGSVRKAADATELQKRLGDGFIALIMDVQDATSIEAARRQTAETIGNQGLACLINNAGVSVYGPMIHVPIEELQYQFDVNVLGVMRVTQAFAPMLGASKTLSVPSGRIIDIKSSSGLITRPFMGPYSASKPRLGGISDALRRELVMYGIKVIIVEPGPIKTEIWRKAAEEKIKFQDTDYAPAFQNVKKAVGSMEGIALDVERCSDLIFEAFQAESPKTRYLISPKKWLFWAAAYLMSDKRLDKMFARQFAKFWKSETISK